MPNYLLWRLIISHFKSESWKLRNFPSPCRPCNHLYLRKNLVEQLPSRRHAQKFEKHWLLRRHGSRGPGRRVRDVGSMWKIRRNTEQNLGSTKCLGNCMNGEMYGKTLDSQIVMQNYKSLRVAVMIWSILVNRHREREGGREREIIFDRLYY